MPEQAIKDKTAIVGTWMDRLLAQIRSDDPDPRR